jgi:hypothetical protein
LLSGWRLLRASKVLLSRRRLLPGRGLLCDGEIVLLQAPRHCNEVDAAAWADSKSQVRPKRSEDGACMYPEFVWNKACPIQLLLCLFSHRSPIMLNRFLGFSVLVAVAFVLGVATAADLKSGPQVGEKLPGSFHPLNCTGDHEGEKYCLICKNGTNPVAMIFARQITPELTKLIKRIDQETDRNKERNMGSFVVFLSDSDTLETELKELAKKEKIDQCILAIDDPEGPKHYNIAQAAEVTVILYTNMIVKSNHTFKKGELNDKGIETIIADLVKILSE